MLKKCITILAFAVAAVMPAAPAAAWEQVCMKLPLWRTWFAGSFYVIHGFHAEGDQLPTFYQAEGRYEKRTLPEGIGIRPAEQHLRATGLIQSSTILANQTRCVDISRIPVGEAFIVYIQTDAFSNVAALCPTHSSNPNKWYHQTVRPYRTLNYESWGAASNPQCKYSHES